MEPCAKNMIPATGHELAFGADIMRNLSF